MFRSRSWKALALATALVGAAAPLARADHRADESPRDAWRDARAGAPDRHLAELRFRHRQLSQQRAQLLRDLDSTVDQRQWRRAQQVIGSLARITAQLDRVESQLPGEHREGGWRRDRRN